MHAMAWARVHIHTNIYMRTHTYTHIHMHVTDFFKGPGWLTDFHDEIVRKIFSTQAQWRMTTTFRWLLWGPGVMAVGWEKASGSRAVLSMSFYIFLKLEHASLGSYWPQRPFNLLLLTKTPCTVYRSTGWTPGPATFFGNKMNPGSSLRSNIYGFEGGVFLHLGDLGTGRS